MKEILYTTEMLTEPSKGIYTLWIHYTDGTIEEVKIPKGPLILPVLLF